MATCELFKKYDCLMEAEFLHEMGSVPDCHRSAFIPWPKYVTSASAAQISAVSHPSTSGIRTQQPGPSNSFRVFLGKRAVQRVRERPRCEAKVMMVLPKSCRSGRSGRSAAVLVMRVILSKVS